MEHYFPSVGQPRITSQASITLSTNMKGIWGCWTPPVTKLESYLKRAMDTSQQEHCQLPRKKILHFGVS